MKRAGRSAGAMGAMVGLIIAASAVLWSCRTDRVSDGYACNDNNDCDADRVCNTGYCVVGQRPVDARLQDAFIVDAATCPDVCKNTCNLTTRDCPITGTGSGNITCPTGWNCDISCPTAGACGTISCTSAADCDIHCTADDACLGITCGTTDCKVDCTGVNACGNIGCTTGKCEALCTGSDACGTLTCTSGDCTQNCSGGGGAQVCGNLSCTTGDCSRTCTGAGACGSMSCNGNTASKCSETCSGGNAACGPMTCTTSKCTATCTGAAPSSCGNVNCDTSCGCEVNCDLTTNACPASMMCATPGARYCSLTGASGSRCTLDGTGGIQQCNACQ
ncbi:MAG TPA: hypothetical protein VMZ53_13655 [Kofleriaceae bacterium]|nr:hypothetical protein [Kofleriaceae bacterium]